MSTLFRTKAVSDIVAELERRRLRPQADARRLRPRDARHRRRHRRRHLLGDRHRRGRARSRADGTVVRYGAGPALVVSFVLLGAVCALAGLCYAELTALIPISGSAYTYAYATLGELVAWIIGWDLILEYAVGNVAVAIAWSGYFSSFLRFFGIDFPFWLCHSYRDVMLSYPERVAELPARLRPPRGDQRARHRDRRAHHLGARDRRPRERLAQQRDGRPQARRPRALRGRRRPLPRPAELDALRPERLARHPPGRGDRLLRLHRLRRRLDRGRGDEGPAAQHAARHPRLARSSAPSSTRSWASWRPASCPTTQLKGSDPLARAFEVAGPRLGPGDHLLRRDRLDDRGAARLPARPAAHLLLDEPGRPAAAGLPRGAPASTARPTSPRSSPASSWPSASTLLDDDETYDLTNIGTLFAFLVVCLGVLALRLRDPHRPRPFRVPFVWVVAPARRRRLPLRDARPAAHGLDPLRRVDGGRDRDLLRLRLPAQPAARGRPTAA